jgi:hypothetical protein
MIASLTRFHCKPQHLLDPGSHISHGRGAILHPETREVGSRFNPRRDRCTEHFIREVTQFPLVGQTPTGRVMVEFLDLHDDRHEGASYVFASALRPTATIRPQTTPGSRHGTKLV